MLILGACVTFEITHELGAVVERERERERERETDREIDRGWAGFEARGR